MVKKDQAAGGIPLRKLPGEKHKDYFDVLIENCITAYGKFFNDKLALDLNKVVGKMRTLVLEDRRYVQETRSLKAKQMLDEISEIEYISSIASGRDTGTGGNDPRARDGKLKTTVDRDMLNMRFKAAQMRRELLSLSAATEEAEEKDSVNIFFVAASRDDLEQLQTLEFEEGKDDGDFDALLDRKEKAPEGSGGKLRKKTQVKAVVEAAYRELPDGTIEEV
jgi:hypothetical protein